MNLQNFTSHQVKSLINKTTGEYSKIRELTKTQLKQKQSKVLAVKGFIESEQKKIKNKEKDILKFKSNLTKIKTKITLQKEKEELTKPNTLILTLC